MIIYKAINKYNDKVYIGQTIYSLEDRKRGHFERYKGETHTKFYDALRKYGWDNFNWSVIDTAKNLIELNKKEIYWINFYGSVNNGYNMAPGGDNNCMFEKEIAQKHDEIMRSENVRIKISNSMKKYISINGFSKAHRQKLSEKAKGNTKFKGRTLNDEHREKLFKARNEVMSNFKHTEETKNKISITSKKNWSNEKKKVDQYDLKGNFIRTFESFIDAVDWLRENTQYKKASRANIRTCIKRGSLVYGYRWNYNLPCVETIESTLTTDL